MNLLEGFELGTRIQGERQQQKLSEQLEAIRQAAERL